MAKKNFTKRPRFQGAIQEGIDVERFRETGESVQVFTPASGRQPSGAGRRGGFTDRERQEEAQRQEERRQREAEARRLEAQRLAEQRRKEQIRIAQARKQEQIKLIRRRSIERRVRETRPSSTIETGVPPESKRLKGLEGIRAGTLERRRRLETKAKKKTITKKEKLIALGLEAGVPIQAGVLGFIQLPRSIVSLVKNPKNIKKVPSSIKESLAREGLETVRVLKISKTRGVARIGGQIFTFVAAGKGIKLTGKVTGRVADKINPRFKEVKDNTLEIKLKGKGEKSTLTLGGVKEGASPLSEQLKLAGTRSEIAVSTIADKIVGAIRRKKLVRKPIPDEDTFRPKTKALLERLDKGRISNKDFSKLNKLVLQDSGKSLLERSIFADPKGILRGSRLGKPQAEARLRDIIRADFTLKSQKPQVLVFADVSIQKLPKNLKDVARKLKANKPLNKDEATRLVRFQTEKSGKFKPIGDTKFQGGIEREITLPAGEIIQRVKKVATTRIAGLRVPIIQVKIFKPTGKLKKLIENAKKGILNPKQIRKLEKTLKKRTGFKQDISSLVSKKITPTSKRKIRKIKRISRARRRTLKRISRRRTPRRAKPILRKRRAGRVIARLSRRIKDKDKSPPRRKDPRVKRRKVRDKSRPRPKPSPRPSTTKRPKPRPRPRPKPKPRKPPTTPRPRPRPKPRPLRPKPRKGIPPTVRKTKRRIARRKKTKPSKSFDVLAKPIKTLRGKKARRLIKVNKVPLSRSKARDLRDHIVDTSLSRTARIKPTKGKPKPSRLKVPAGESKRIAKKFRKFRVVKGKRIPLKKGRVIERTKHILDTRQEKRKISLRRRIKQITIKPKKKKMSMKKSKRKKR